MVNYSEYSVSLLRKMLADRKIGPKVGSGVWRAKANKATCILALEQFDSNGLEYVNNWLTECGVDHPDDESAAGWLEDNHPEWNDVDANPPEAKPSPVKPYGDGLSSALANLQEVIQSQAGSAGVTEQQVIDLIDEHMGELGTSVFVFDAPGFPEVEISRQHFMFPLLLACHDAGVPAMMVGPAGSGKTSAAGAIAQARSKNWDAVSMGPMTTKADLFGYQDANGTYHESSLVKTATNGGVFLADEMDAANAGVLTGCNMVLANGHIATPVGMRDKHADFWFCAGANTFGTGANRQYVGRNALDAATLDRFAVIDWPVDEGLEAMLVGVAKRSQGFDILDGGKVEPSEWLSMVQRYRKAAEKLKIKTVISPRATIYGCRLCRNVGLQWLLKILIFKGLPEETIKRLTAEFAATK